MKKISVILLVLLAMFITFLGIRMNTLDVNIELVKTLSDIESQKPVIEFKDDVGQWAVAVNGESILKNTEFTEKRPTASTTKMILALSVMDKKPFTLGESGETITITQEMYDIYNWYINNNGSSTSVRVGEEISEYEALESVLLASSNNMADSLAIWAFGSLDEYKNYASEMLIKIGATNTTIGKDASGYDKSTVSTTEDLAKIGNAVFNQPVLAEIVGKTEANVPVAGTIKNTNKLLGTNRITGIKTGYIGDVSGYCLVSGYKEGLENVTVAMLGLPTRQESFDDSLEIITKVQEKVKVHELVKENEEVGFYKSWWLGEIPIKTENKIDGIIVSEPEINLRMNEYEGELEILTPETNYKTKVKSEKFAKEPNFWQRFLRVFGWEQK